MPPKPTAQTITNVVALEHSYTIPPHALNGRRSRSKKPHKQSTAPQLSYARTTEIQTQLSASQVATTKGPVSVEVNTSPTKTNKRCSTIKHLLAKPPILHEIKARTPEPRDTMPNLAQPVLRPQHSFPTHQPPAARSQIQDTVMRPTQTQAAIPHDASNGINVQVEEPDLYVDDGSQAQSRAAVAQPPAGSTLQSGSHEQTLQSPLAGADSIVQIAATKKTESSSASGDSVQVNGAGDKLKSSSLPSISHAIEMVKLQQKVSLTSLTSSRGLNFLQGEDSRNVAHTIKSANKAIPESVSTQVSKFQAVSQPCTVTTLVQAKTPEPSQILSQLSTPPMVPVLDVKYKSPQTVRQSGHQNSEIPASKLSTATQLVSTRMRQSQIMPFMSQIPHSKGTVSLHQELLKPSTSFPSYSCPSTAVSSVQLETAAAQSPNSLAIPQAAIPLQLSAQATHQAATSETRNSPIVPQTTLRPSSEVAFIRANSAAEQQNNPMFVTQAAGQHTEVSVPVFTQKTSSLATPLTGSVYTQVGTVLNTPTTIVSETTTTQSVTSKAVQQCLIQSATGITKQDNPQLTSQKYIGDYQYYSTNNTDKHQVYFRFK